MSGTLIFEISRAGKRCARIPACDVPAADIPETFLRRAKPCLPEVSEVDLVRHYTRMSKEAYGVDDGFYPLGSCTMKYNPKVNEDIAALKGFTGIHPMQPPETVAGCRAVIERCEAALCEITGMDRFDLRPAAGAHGEYAGLMLIRGYFAQKGEERKTVLVPDTAHGTNPATATMAGYAVKTVPSGADGCVDIAALRAMVDSDTAALMLTNPNTLGLFEKDILTIAAIVHEAGGLLYYDGANMNAVMGVARPGDMGFDVVHLNLHKTFATPHGGGGPGSGPVGYKAHLLDHGNSFPTVVTYHGNFLVYLKALAYIMILGGDGLRETAENAVLNANYLLASLSPDFDVPYGGGCMHEFVLSMSALKRETGISAGDVAKNLLDAGIHPPTMYFPLVVAEALMIEPTETESLETLDSFVARMQQIRALAYDDDTAQRDALHKAPMKTPVGRLDEVKAARHPKVRYQ